jgi:hypothetical protein
VYKLLGEMKKREIDIDFGETVFVEIRRCVSRNMLRKSGRALWNILEDEE